MENYWRKQYALARAEIRLLVSGFDTYNKRDSRLHRLIGRLFALVGVRAYMEGMYTTLNYRAAEPVTVPPYGPDDWEILCHEGWHAYVHAKISAPLAALLYLLPNAGALVTLALAVMAWPSLGVAAAWLAATVVLALPLLPSPFRALVELRGYAVQMVIHDARGEWVGVDEDTLMARYESVADLLAGQSYWRALPSKRLARWLVRRTIRRVGAQNLSHYERHIAAFAKTV